MKSTVVPLAAREGVVAPARLRDVQADGTFSGYASLFGRMDLGRDLVMPGAFAESLRSKGARGIKLLFQHNPDEPIGVWVDVREDARGLLVHGRLLPAVARAREVLELMRGSDGGYLVPPETEAAVIRGVKEISPIRAIAGNRTVSASIYKKPFSITGPATGWVAETATRPETNSPTLDELAFPTMELYAMPSATQTLLDDSAVNIDEWLAEEIQIAFAEQEGTAFVTGDGDAKPRGFLDYTPVANGSWAWDKIGYIATGNDGTFDTANPSDDLIDLVYSLKSGYRANAHWVMNRATQAVIRKFKDDDGNYLWHPGEKAGAWPTLMNYPIAESEDMPDIGSDEFAIAFGDFKRGYLVVDRAGIRVLRDPYSAKPYVLFYTTKRVGGGVQDFDAIKLLKFGSS
ncbi:phage major capsid protein [Methyloligella solikamskensis]|uniref:Phage major capsid protein n=1 Tax=Methyloligella solikamskensis TaxID=1177756 RepID=A0ABW3J9L1_9HYPH